MLRHVLAAALAVLPAMGMAATVSGPFSNTFVFGDSLSDPGNTPLGVFTDTAPWSTQVGLDVASGRNFAVGGATATSNPMASDFAEQRSTFAQSGPHIPAYSQAVVWFGGNDLLALLLDPSLDPNAVIAGAVGSLSFGIQDLAANFGIDRIVVPGLPDFSTIPAGFGSIDAQRASLGFNAALQGLVAALNAPSAFFPNGIDVRYVDIAAATTAALNDPAFASGLPPANCNQGTVCDGLVFWDGIHPTGAAHVLIADAITAELAPIPLPASAPLLLVGFVALGAMRLRARANA